MKKRQRDLVLGIVATDATFARTTAAGVELWVGKCLHCGAHLSVSLAGDPLGSATIEHIRPRSQGGTDDLENLALACARCNNQKGVRHDASKHPTRRAQEVTLALMAKRRQRWRLPGEPGVGD